MIENPFVGMRVYVPGLNVIGTVCHIDEGGVIGVDLGSPDLGWHSCHDYCPQGHGRYFAEAELDPADGPETEPGPTQIPVGTRVTYTGPGPRGQYLTEEPGTVVGVSAYSGVCGVRLDRNVGGHNLSGTCDHGYGWFCQPSNLTITAPQEPVVGSRVRVNGYVSGVGEFVGDGTVVVISDETIPGREPLGVRFDDRVEGGHDLDHHGEAMCPDGYGLWVSRGIVTVLSGGPPMPVAAPTTSSPLFEELLRSPKDSNDLVPDDVLEGTDIDICRHLIATNGVGATPHEYTSLVTLIKGIRQRWNMKSTAGNFVSRLAEVEF